MNCNVLKFFSQNVRKNKLIIDTILEIQFSYSILLIQEPPWATIRLIPSSKNYKGELLVGVPHHSNWLTFTRNPTNHSNFPRVITYINIHVSCFRFSLWNDVLNHRDISCISFSNQVSVYFIINVYSNSSQSALKYLKDTETNIYNMVIMTSDFNIRDCSWNSNFPFHSSHSDSLFDITDSFSLEISKPMENVPTRYSDNDHKTNLVLDLVFLRPSSPEFNHHHIHPNWRLSSNHAPITVDITIRKETLLLIQWMFAKGSNEEKHFVNSIAHAIKNVNMTSIQNAETLEKVVMALSSNIEELWQRHSKTVKITKHSKVWWNNNCQLSLDRYWHSRSLKNWCSFKNMVKNSK